MPNAVLEAMGCRLPVAASDVEGVRELLGPLGREQIAPQGDAGALSERIIAIASNPVLSESLGNANRRRAEERFSLEAMVDAYSHLLHRLANR
jgi:glycosyltransferase involved in cell wall biosynthesis